MESFKVAEFNDIHREVISSNRIHLAALKLHSCPLNLLAAFNDKSITSEPFTSTFMNTISSDIHENSITSLDSSSLKPLKVNVKRVLLSD